MLKEQRFYKKEVVTNMELRPNEVINALKGLKQNSGIKGVGFDVFDTLLKSLYSYDEMVTLLASEISLYLTSQGTPTSNELVTKIYTSTRTAVKDKLVTENNFIVAKELECPESLVLEGVVEHFGIVNKSAFMSHIHRKWLEYDLSNIKEVDGMREVVVESIKLFGQDRVGIYTNNSYEEKHIFSILKHTGLLENDMFLPSNVCTSVTFGREKYGIGLRKPNTIAFNEFSRQLNIKPTETAFVGDGKNDVLFANKSGGIGLKLLTHY